jgi:CheY-like chemotaxis protein
MPASIGLVVDDDPHIRGLFAQVLRRGGIQILEARSGLEALEIAQTSALDFVITDIEMPVMDGLELCRRLRRLTTTTMLPIVAVTGAPSQADEATAAGCDVVLPKPCSPALLLATIQSLIVKATESTKE